MQQCSGQWLSNGSIVLSKSTCQRLPTHETTSVKAVSILLKWIWRKLQPQCESVTNSWRNLFQVHFTPDFHQKKKFILALNLHQLLRSKQDAIHTSLGNLQRHRIGLVFPTQPNGPIHFARRMCQAEVNSYVGHYMTLPGLFQFCTMQFQIFHLLARTRGTVEPQRHNLRDSIPGFYIHKFSYKVNTRQSEFHGKSANAQCIEW